MRSGMGIQEQSLATSRSSAGFLRNHSLGLAPGLARHRRLFARIILFALLPGVSSACASERQLCEPDVQGTQRLCEQAVAAHLAFGPGSMEPQRGFNFALALCAAAELQRRNCASRSGIPGPSF